MPPARIPKWKSSLTKVFHGIKMKITPERRMQDAGRQRIKQFPKALIEELLQVEINRHLGAQRYERSDDRRDWRNGSYERTLSTRCGTVEDPAHPANAKQRLRPQLFDRYERRSKSVDELRHPGLVAMAHHPMRRFRVPAALETSARRILVCLRVFGLLLTFSFSGWILTGCSGLKGSQSINSAAPSITRQPANQNVTAGQTATFTVAATGTAPLSYQWRKNGTAVARATSSTYAMPSTISSDNGAQFTVVLSNSVGSVTSSVAMLTVSAASVAPSVTMQPA